MKNGVESKRKFKSLVDSVKRISDDPNALINSTYDNYKDDISSINGVVKKNINDFTSKIKGRTENKKDIFGDIIETVEGILGNEKEDPLNQKKNPLIQTKLLQYAKESARKTILLSRQLINDEIKFGFFGSQGSCDPNTEIVDTTYNLSPKQFDFINMLKIAPNSISGKMIYETSPQLGIGVQFNRKLYENFDLVGAETIYKSDGTPLFDIEWNSGSQSYNIYGMGSGVKFTDFIDDYYNTIEQPNIENIMTNAMLLALQGDGSEAKSFNVGLDNLNRLTTKMFSLCGNKENQGSPFLSNTIQQINEDETDIQDYFNFDILEGIDLDDEDARKRRVLKFVDCDNFEIPTNSNHIEDFAYLLQRKNLDENIKNTLNKIAIDAYEQSDSNINFDGFRLSIIKSYILKIPNAMISSVLSPKMIFPIALSFQIIYNQIIEVKELMKKLATTFFNIIKKLFWEFIKEFWKFIKRDLLIFIKKTAMIIISNKVKKIKGMILSLIRILMKVLDNNIQSCEEIFDALLQTIQSALNKSVKVSIPGLLLVLAQQRPGFSSDRANMSAIEKMEQYGINVGPIYGSENKISMFSKSIIDAYSNEMDTNSFIKIALNPTMIPVGPGGVALTPLITGGGLII